MSNSAVVAGVVIGCSSAVADAADPVDASDADAQIGSGVMIDAQWIKIV